MRHTRVAALTIVLAVSCFAQTDSPKTGATDTNVIAVVLGKKITGADQDKLRGLIFGPLLRQFAMENKLEPTEEELNTFILKLEDRRRQHRIEMEVNREKLKAELSSSSLSDREREQKASRLKTTESILKMGQVTKEQNKGVGEQIRPMMRRLAQRFVRPWKTNKSLYDIYGGRVIFQQAGVEPLDAYREFLKEEEKKGAFEIIDKRYEPEFWRYFTNDVMHTFCKKDDGAKLINTPWWMTEEAPEE